MSLLDELRTYLAQPVLPDPAPYRRHLIDALETLEARKVPVARLQGLVGAWSGAPLDRFISIMFQEVRTGLGYGMSAEGIEELCTIALERALGLGTSTGSVVRDSELDRLGRLAKAASPAPDVAPYAFDLRALRKTAGGVSVTPIGKLILELPDSDAVRWILALEVVQSTGHSQARLLSTAGAAWLIKQGDELEDLENHPEPGPVPRIVLSRLGRLRVYEATPDIGSVRYWMLPQGRACLTELATGNETPFTLLARALLQDETTLTVGQLPDAKALVTRESAAEVTTRHARMVAHEIRNALVPVQMTLNGLYGDVTRHGAGELLEGRRPAIDSGIERIFQFVTQVAAIADLATKPPELFDMGSAVRAAVTAVEHELERAVRLTPTEGLPQVLGHRDRFVLTVANIVRNACQARTTPPVTVEVTTGAINGAAVFVQIDDDGPGVPLEDRHRVFEHGFSTRPGGSGQGLAFARGVVTSEMAGQVFCEESPLGGARFVVRLPVGSKRQS